MRPPAPIPPALTDGPFTTALALEWTTADAISGPSYQTLLRGVHARAGAITHEERILAARLAVPGAVLGGLSAMWAYGARVAGEEDAVEMVVSPGTRRRNREHLVVRTATLLRGEVMDSRLGPVTTPARTAFDVGRATDPLHVVPRLDALLNATGVTKHQVMAVAARHPGARWIRRLPTMLDLADPKSESIRESQLRVLVVLAGLPRPVTQFTVTGREGFFIARVDLAWPELGVVVEYDGAHHDSPDQIARDRSRVNALRAAGWTVLVIDRAQFRNPEEVVRLIRSVLEERMRSVRSSALTEESSRRSA